MHEEETSKQNRVAATNQLKLIVATVGNGFYRSVVSVMYGAPCSNISIDGGCAPVNAAPFFS